MKVDATLYGTITRHFVGIVFALLIGISVITPHLLWRLNSRYQGIDSMGQDAEEHYIARVNEVTKGNVELGNTFLPDKDKPYAQPPLGEIIQAAFGRIFFLNTVDGILLAKFVFPFLNALVVYVLVFVISRSRTAALVATGSAILGFSLMSGLGPWLDLLHGVVPIGAYSIFSRPINPQISSLLMFVGLFVFYCGFFERRNPRWWEIAATGLLTGISAYVSPYTFTFLGGVIGISCVWFFIRRQYPLAFSALYAGIIGVIATIPFFINYLALKASPEYAALAARQGLVADHHLTISFWLFAMLAGAIFLWPKVYTKSRPFFIICIAALIILTDQNVLTGITLQPSHYHWYITKPLLGIFAGMYAAFVIGYLFKQRYVQAVLACAILFVLFYTSPLLHIQKFAAHPDPTIVAAQDYMPVIRALNTLPGTQTVWTSSDMSLYLSIYTKDNAPNNPYASYYLNPREFYEDVLFLNYRLTGQTPATILTAFTKDRTAISLWLDGLYWRQTKGDLAAIPDSELAALAQKYAAFYTRTYVDIFKELGITVVVAPVGEKAEYDKITDLHLFASPLGYSVYTVMQ